MLTLPDVIAPGLTVVFCAPALGECAALRGHYYAGPGQSFWQLLHDSGLTPHRLAPADDDSLPAYGLGLVDVVRVSPRGQRPEQYDVRGFLESVRQNAPSWVAFNGKHAAAIVARHLGHPAPPLGQVDWRIAAARVFVLPSSSGANRRREYDGRATRLSWWAELARTTEGVDSRPQEGGRR